MRHLKPPATARGLAGAAGLVVALAGFPPLLFGQEGESDGAEATGEPGTVQQLDAIRVEGAVERATGPVDGYRAERSATATGTDRAIQDTPASVQVVPREVIEDQQAFELREVLQNVSGVTAAEGSTLIEARESVFVRGFRSRAVYYDGFRAEALPGLDLANVERVEILKGPASIVAGQVEPGGLVNIVPKRPGREPSTRLGLEAGDYGFRRGTVDLTRTARDGAIGGRLIGSITDSDSFRDFVEIERQTVTPSFRADVGARGQVEVELLHHATDRQFDEGVAFDADGSAADDITTFLGGPDLAGSELDWSGARVTAAFDVTDAVTLRGGFLYQDFGHDWEAFRPLGDPGEEPVSNTGLAQRAGIPINAVPEDPVAEDEIFRFYDRTDLNVETIEARFEALSRFVALGWDHEVIVGVNVRRLERDIDETRGFDVLDPDTGEFLPQKINIRTPVHDAPVPTQNVADGRLDGEQDELGFYVRDIIVGGRDGQWNLLAGLRHDEVEQASVSDRAVDELASGSRNVQRSEKTDEAVTGRLGLLYRVNDAVAPFASFSQSFAPSGTKVSGNTGELLDPTRGEQLEVGAKFRLPGGVSGTAAAYRIDREDVPIQDPDDRTRFVNGGAQRSEGFELDLAGAPAASVDVLASLGFTDARWVESTQVDPGTPLRGVPGYSASVTTRWQMRAGPLRGFRLSGTVFRADARPGDDQDSFELDGFTTLSLGLARDWRIGDQHLSTRLAVKNVTDERYFVASNSKASVVPAAPRTIRAAIDWAF